MKEDINDIKEIKKMILDSINEVAINQPDSFNIATINHDINFDDIGLSSIELVEFNFALDQKIQGLSIELYLLFSAQTNTINKLSKYIQVKLEEITNEN